MAWDECKIQTKQTITKTMENEGIPLKKAIASISEETGIPPGTLKEWYYAQDGGRESLKNKSNDLSKKNLENQTKSSQASDIIEENISENDINKIKEKEIKEKKRLKRKRKNTTGHITTRKR